MPPIRLQRWRRHRVHLWLGVPVVFLAATTAAHAQSSGNRILGIDVSAWQGNISQTTWNNLRSVENRQFAFMRASRGGTTGFDKRAGGYPSNDNDDYSLSQRYDDPYFVQNMNRATAAGMFVGSYHFSRPDVITTTTNSGGIANTAVDEADHYIQMAGAFMRPGYLPPTFDLETGEGLRTDNELAQFSIDFSNRLYDVMRIRPMIYINGNYAQNVLGGATAARRDQLAKPAAVEPSLAGPAFTQLWSARYPNPTNPNAINVQTGNANDSFSTLYGPWDDYGDPQPWTFWQYASTGRLASFNNGNSDLDFNVVQGGIEFLKDQLVPAVWWNDSSGDWSTLANWNSGQPAIVPIQAPNQLTPIGTQTLPTPRLPGASGTAPTSGQHDTVILDRPTADITVTLSSGSHGIRKFFVREAFTMSGGTLSLNYVPVAESTPMSMQVSAPVSISGGARLSAHTILVDAARTLTAGTATLTFDTLTLTRGATPATLAVNGDLSIAATGSGTARIGTSSGTAATGRVDLTGGTRTVTVTNGTATIDLQIGVPIVNGGLVKAGAGTMELTAASTYTGQTVVQAGTLVLGAGATIAASPGIRVDAGAVFDVTPRAGGYALPAGQTLAGSGSVAGAVTVGTAATLAPGNSPGTLSIGGTVTLGPGGSYNWQILSATGTAGATGGWDLLSVTGPLVISASTGSPFAINLWSLAATGPDVNGPIANFSATQNYTWRIATASGGITGFSADAFRINTSATNGTGGFANASTGTFSLAQSGNALNLVYTAPPALVAINVASGTQTQAQAGHPLLSGTIPVQKTGAGTAVLNQPNPLTGPTTVAQGGLKLATADTLASSAVTVAAGARLSVAPQVAAMLPALANNGLVDVGQGGLTIAAGQTAGAVVAAIVAGRNDGAWNGATGITSSAAATQSERAVGWLDNGDGSFTVGYAAAGDWNVNGVVDFDDVVQFVSAGLFDTGLPATWAQGDYDYSGTVDFDDVLAQSAAGLFDAGPYNAPPGGLAPLAFGDDPAGLGAGFAAVPEPATWLLAAMAAAGAMLSRPRRARRRA